VCEFFLQLLIVKLNSSFRAAAEEYRKFFYNDVGFIVAIAITDNALFDSESLEDIRMREIPETDNELVLTFKNSALERIIL
jgi:hypothetical protein